jgi:hypothetical protein
MLVRAPLATPAAQHWTAVFKYDPATQLKGITCFASAVVLHGRKGGFSQLWVYKPTAGKLAKGEPEPEAARTLIPHPEPVYCAFGGSNHNYHVGFTLLACVHPSIPLHTLFFHPPFALNHQHMPITHPPTHPPRPRRSGTTTPPW